MESPRRSTQTERPPVEVKQRVRIRKIVDRLELPERAELAAFLERLDEIRASSLDPVKKLQAALADARARRTAVFVLERAASELKDLAWDDRGWAARLGLTAATVAAIPTAGQGAGIAALGTAIGVPLWVVFGAGGTFAGALIEELKRSLPDGSVAAEARPGTALVHIPEAEYELLGVYIDEWEARLVREARPDADEGEADAGRFDRVRQAFRRRKEALSHRLRSRLGR